LRGRTRRIINVASLGYIVRGKKPPTTEQQKDKLTILKRFK
jgi:hypothetical protein